MVVKITQEQVNYLKTFGDFKDESNKKHALHFITRFGWGFRIKDGYGEESEAFDNTETLLMAEAVINGYEVAVPKFKFHNFSNESGIKRLYYAGADAELTSDEYDATKVEEGSKEYSALVDLGFFKEEV